MKNLVLIFVVAISGFSSSVAQDIKSQSLEWQSSSTFAITPGTITEESTKVVSSPTQILWYNKDGVLHKTFTITGSSGAWTNVSNNGSITFNVTFEDHSGAISFSKAGGVTLIRLYLVEGEEPSIFELTINNINSI